MRQSASAPLRGKTVLIVEDEYLIAQDLALALGDAGAIVIGPASSETKAAALLEGATPNLALLNIRLNRSEKSFALAERLDAAGVPFLFVSGYDGSSLPAEFASRPRLEKPVQSDVLLEAVCALLYTAPAAQNDLCKTVPNS